jgi:hypothetical protein
MHSFLTIDGHKYLTTNKKTNLWHLVKDGDGCEGIAASFSLTPDAFYAMVLL